MNEKLYTSMRTTLIKTLRQLEDEGVALGYTPEEKRAVMTREEKRMAWRMAYEEGVISGRMTPIEEL